MRSILPVLLLFSISLHAQLPSEKYDSLARAISLTQSASAGKMFINGKTEYQLSFAEENFVFSFATKLAAQSVYRFAKGVDLLYLTENIDLAQCTKISIDKLKQGDVEVVKLSFPKGSLKTKILDAKGRVQSTIAEDDLYFYYDNSPGIAVGVDLAKQNPYALMSALAELCYRCKVEKKLMTESQMHKLLTAWKNCMEARDEVLSEYQFFLQNYPSTLYSPTVRKYTERAKRIMEGKIDW